uniref:uncharacterized protein LOC101478449 n=1 Tax=Maylandia zebra TaxID=106582 RepID=UPI000D30035E|nr:uncharacterized protein LOC101478449 [Maylandia zebra]
MIRSPVDIFCHLYLILFLFSVSQMAVHAHLHPLNISVFHLNGQNAMEASVMVMDAYVSVFHPEMKHSWVVLNRRSCALLENLIAMNQQTSLTAKKGYLLT